jgi:hypothetical protein
LSKTSHHNLFKGFAALGDGIGFKEAGAGFIPLVGLMGICFLRRVPGLVVVRPRFLYWMRTEWRMRSMVAGEIWSKACETSGAKEAKDWL